MDFFADMQEWLTQNKLRETGVVIFGTGGGGHILHEFFTRTGVPVKAFLDNYNSGLPICLGCPVFHGDSAPSFNGVAADTPVIISVVNFAHYKQGGVEECRAQLYRAGWTRVATRPQWLAALFQEHQVEIAAVRKLWVDEKSRRLYEQALQFVGTRLAEYEPQSQQPSYFPEDVPAVAGPLRWIQGGAYIGDNISQALDLGLEIDEAAFFEPDPVNFAHLSARVQVANIKGMCWPCGLWSKVEALRFSAGRGADSLVDPDGTVLIQGLDLDSALPTFAPNLITLDVEGAELEALQGMERSIIKSQPHLAISIYHCPDDWWRLPLWLNNINESQNLAYRFYLRVHGPLATDVIIYAVK